MGIERETGPRFWFVRLDDVVGMVVQPSSSSPLSIEEEEVDFIPAVNFAHFSLGLRGGKSSSSDSEDSDDDEAAVLAPTDPGWMVFTGDD